MTPEELQAAINMTTTINLEVYYYMFSGTRRRPGAAGVRLMPPVHAGS